MRFREMEKEEDYIYICVCQRVFRGRFAPNFLQTPNDENNNNNNDNSDNDDDKNLHVFVNPYFFLIYHY